MASPSEITPGELSRLTDVVTVVDVREPSEYEAGHIESSVHLPLGTLREDITEVVADKGRPIVVYCATGARSGVGAAVLREMGYESVSNLDGGFEGWKDAGLAWTAPPGISNAQSDRYSRHLNLPGVGVSGQVKLLNASVVIVGAGGLGSPVGLYLAAAGVGTIGIVDHDSVDASNLQRQVLHGVDAIGMPKTESARERIVGLNPDVKVETHGVRLTASNVIDVLDGYDLIVDATDNFPTRYLINDASLHLRIPVVHASIYRFEGQVSVFQPYAGPCYRCLFEVPPPPELAPSCETGGVLGVLPGVVGSLQATEAIKLILDIGEPLVGQLMIYDALEQETSRLQLKRNPGCPACGDESNPPRLVDYDELCLPA